MKDKKIHELLSRRSSRDSRYPQRLSDCVPERIDRGLMTGVSPVNSRIKCNGAEGMIVCSQLIRVKISLSVDGEIRQITVAGESHSAIRNSDALCSVFRR